MRVFIFGSTSDITFSLIDLYRDQEVVTINRKDKIFSKIRENKIGDYFQDDDIVIYLSSILYSKRIETQTEDEIFNSCFVNAISPIKIIKHLNKHVANFTFCYISSESAKKGSFDDSYHIFKGAVDNFIREFSLTSSKSRIFCIAPSTIDSGMTKRRKDVERLNEYRVNHPMQRFISANEIANIIYTLCTEKFSYLSNTIVEINGGKYARNRY